MSGADLAAANDSFVPSVIIPTKGQLTMAMFYIPFVYFGVITNGLLVAVIARTKAFRTESYQFLVSLALSDMCFLFFGPQQRYNNIINLWNHGDYVFHGAACWFLGIINNITLSANMLNMMAIAFNRYVLIVRFQVYKRLFTMRNTRVYIVVIWAVSFAGSLPMIVLGTGIGYNPFIYVCMVYGDTLGDAYVHLLEMRSIAAPPVVACFYLAILGHMRLTKRKVMSHRRRGNNPTDKDEPNIGPSKEEVALLLQFGIIVVIYLLSWGIHCILSALMVAKVGNVRAYPWNISSFLIAVNSAINPTIYYVANKQMRDAVHSLLTCGMRQPAAGQNAVTAANRPAAARNTGSSTN